MSAIAQHWPLALALAGLLAAMTGTAAITWLVAGERAAAQRRRAERAEEQLARLRAQCRQRREPLRVLPGLFPELDRADRAEADTVLLGAVTPYAQHLLADLGRRPR